MKSFSVIDVPQRSPEWFQARCGRLTGSCAKDMLATIRSGEAAARRDLRLRLAVERLTGQSQDGQGYVSADMQRGIDLEGRALAAYEALTGHLVETTGFLAHPTLLAGCSLDGHVGDFAVLVSLKCPKSATHWGYLQDGDMPSAYVPQMLHELWITGADAYDFLSYDDRFVPELATFYVRTLRADVQDQIDAYAEKARAFLADVDAEVDRMVRLAASRRVEVA